MGRYRLPGSLISRVRCGVLSSVFDGRLECLAAAFQQGGSSMQMRFQLSILLRAIDNERLASGAVLRAAPFSHLVRDGVDDVLKSTGSERCDFVLV